MRGKDNLPGGTRGPLAVTGAGIVSAAGRGMAPLVEALRAGRSFLAPLPPERRGLRTGGPLTGIVPDDAIPAGAGRSVRLASAALRDATDAAWGREARSRRRPERIGVTVGTALGAAEDVELEGLAAGGPRAVAEARADDLSFARFGERVARSDDGGAGPSSRPGGPCSVFSATCVSGLCALEQAAADIALDRADAVVVVGIDTLSDVMLAGFTSLGIVSRSGQVRPFHGSDAGIAIGEAACAVVIEPLHEARERSDRPAACILAQTLESDAYHLTTPDPSGRGMARAIRRSMAGSGLTADELGGILVTAAGSAVYDRMLSRAVEEALGARGREIPVSTWEPAIGHVLAATGIVALAFATEVLARGYLPAVYPVSSSGETLEPVIDPECRLGYVLDGPRSLERPVLLALIVGFGGQNGAVVLASPECAGRSPAC